MPRKSQKRPRSQAQTKLPLHGPQYPDPFALQREAPMLVLFDRIWWSKGMDCIDLGCGTGVHTSALHERLRSASCIGVDANASHIQRAKSRQTQELRFIHAEPLNWTPTNPVDLVLLNQPNLKQISLADWISKLVPQLSSEGQALIHLPRYLAHPIATSARTLALSKPFKSLFNEPELTTDSTTSIELSTILTNHGFVEQQVEEHVLVHRFASNHRVQEWLLEFALPTVKPAHNTELFESFMANLGQHIEAIAGTPTPFIWPTVHLIAWARLPKTSD